jgi:hypothetical protein
VLLDWSCSSQLDLSEELPSSELLVSNTDADESYGPGEDENEPDYFNGIDRL